MNHSNSGASCFGALLDAVDAERAQLGCKLHDTIVQNLAAISIHLTGLLTNTSRDKEARDTIQECVSLVDESLREIRSVSHHLSPIPVPEMDLAGCIETLRELAAADGVSLRVDVSTLRRVKLGRCSRDALVRVIWDCTRGLAETGVTEIDLGVGADRALIQANMAADTPVQRQIAADSLWWWIAQERVGRLGGELKVDVSGGRQSVEFSVPIEEESWAAAY
jgi:signal transduction histidine kinase